MNKLTYIEARDKIWNAYFRDEIQPAEAQFCFCGTLCDNSSAWFGSALKKHVAHSGYTGNDFVKMEAALFRGAFEYRDGKYYSKPDREYEDGLFAGMLAALEVLKQIHRDRGDYIPEDEPLLTKRTIEKITL